MYLKNECYNHSEKNLDKYSEDYFETIIKKLKNLNLVMNIMMIIHLFSLTKHLRVC